MMKTGRRKARNKVIVRLVFGACGSLVFRPRSQGLSEQPTCPYVREPDIVTNPIFRNTPDPKGGETGDVPEIVEKRSWRKKSIAAWEHTLSRVIIATAPRPGYVIYSRRDARRPHSRDGRAPKTKMPDSIAVRHFQSWSANKQKLNCALPFRVSLSLNVFPC